MSDFRKLVDQVASGKRMDEVSPPGYEGTVKAMKKSGEVDNPYALAWWMKNKGYKSNKKDSGEAKESQGDPASIDGGQQSVYTGANELGLTPEDMQALEMDEDGTGAPYDVNIATDPTDTNPYVDNPEDLNPEVESIFIDHPQKGRGIVLEINETNIVVEWNNLQLSILGPERVPFSEAKYLFRVDERYSDDPSDAAIDGRKKKKVKKDKKVKKVKKDKKDKKDKKVREGGLASEIPEAHGDLATQTGHNGSDWSPSLQDDPDDSPDVTDFKAPGDNDEDGVKSVVQDGVRSDMRGKAHRSDSRKGTRAKVHSNEGKQNMTKKIQLDEHMVAIQGTYRGGESDFNNHPKLDLTMDDLLEYAVPDPKDSVLTTGDQSPDEKASPLSTEAGASAAHDSLYPDGDMADDAPADAPDLPKYDNIDDGGNERDVETGVEPKADLSGSSKSTKSSGSYNDSEDTNDTKDTKDTNDTDEDEEKDEMDESILSWEDIGLKIDEGCGGEDNYGDEMIEDGGCGCENDGMGVSGTKPSMTNENDGTVMGVSMTRDLLDRLLKDIRDQQPEDDKIGYISSGLEAAAREKGSELGVEDIQMIMGEIKEAFTGQDVDGDGDGVENTPEEQENGDLVSDAEDSPNSVGNESDGGEFEDRAAGDGEPAGPEGGEEHEGKTKLMDKNDTNEDVGSTGPTGNSGPSSSGPEGSSGSTGGFGNENTSKNVKPVSQNSSKGSGPGGSNTDGGGQDGSIPQVDNGTQRGTPGGPLSKDGGGRSVAPISESRVDETMVAVGMAPISSVMRGYSDGPDIDPSDPDAEIKMIRRRAGLPQWWKLPS